MSNRIDELDKLDETRLLAIAGMYAEKRRRKHWHDQNIKTKWFQQGDLVLLYTLKKHKRKLKKRGIGPFVVSELTSSGAVRLETLDGAQMPNFINGSRLKKFEQPLTEGMIQQLHQAKTYKEGQIQLKEQAQIEAQERRQKMRTRREVKIMAVTGQNAEHEDFKVKPFTIHLQLTTDTREQFTTAMIDSGADCNVMSYDMWESLGMPKLTPSMLIFKSFSGFQTPSLGKLHVKTLIKKQIMEMVFDVTHKDQAAVDIILGRQWIYETNCQLDWITRQFVLHVGSSKVMGKKSELEAPTVQTQKQLSTK